MTESRDTDNAPAPQVGESAVSAHHPASCALGEPPPRSTTHGTSPPLPPGWGIKAWSLVSIMGGIFVWAFWYSLEDLRRVWQHNPDYSAGQLVPAAVVYMIAVRRHTLATIPLTFDWRGASLFMFGVIANLLGNYYFYASLQNFGLVVCASGLVMTLLGWRGYKQFWFPMVFLVLAVPLPGRIHNAVMLPLQKFVAYLSAITLEVIGVPVVRWGHILEINGRQIAVAEACSGLRMALAFLMVSGVVAYLVRRPNWQRVTIVLSSLPIAIACNIVRVVTTALLYGTKYEWLAHDNMHDVMGMVMMPVAMGLILMELWLLAKLTHKRQPAGIAYPSSFAR